MKRFHVGDVLSVSTGICCRVPFGGQELIEFLVGYPVWTHQLPRLFKPCSKYLNDKYPALAPFAESINSETWLTETARAVEILGETMEIEPMPAAPDPVEPLGELVNMMRPDQKIIVVAGAEAGEKEGAE